MMTKVVRSDSEAVVGTMIELLVEAGDDGVTINTLCEKLSRSRASVYAYLRAVDKRSELKVERVAFTTPAVYRLVA